MAKDYDIMTTLSEQVATSERITELETEIQRLRTALLPFIGPWSEVTMQDKQRASELIGDTHE